MSRHWARLGCSLLALGLVAVGCSGGSDAGSVADGPGATGPGTGDDGRGDDPALAAVLADVVADPATEPGCAVAVSRDGEVVATATAGLADLEHDIPISLDSVFDIGSVSKQFTAAALLLVAEDDVLAPSDDLRDHLPDLPAWGGPISLDQAMHHTSGIPDYVPLLGEGYLEDDVSTADEAYLLLLAAQTPDFAPGTSWSYSNSNYFLLGLAIEEATGESLEEVLTEKIFDPLALDDTSVRDHYEEVIPGLATAYRADDELGGWGKAVTRWEQVGDGGMHSTVLDLLSWQAALTSGEAAPFDLYDALRSSPVDMGNGESSYARGIIESTSSGTLVVGHSGTEAGYRSALEARPDDGLAAAVLCNRADADAEAIALDSLDAVADG